MVLSSFVVFLSSVTLAHDVRIFSLWRIPGWPPPPKTTTLEGNSFLIRRIKQLHWYSDTSGCAGTRGSSFDIVNRCHGKVSYNFREWSHVLLCMSVRMLKRIQVVDLVLFICTLFCTTLISKYVIIMVYIFQRLSNAVVTTEISLLFDGRSTAVRLLIKDY